MIREHFEFRQTIATILADDPRQIAAAKTGMMTARQEVERQVTRDPYFSATFEPYTPQSPEKTAGRMARAAAGAGVGPMAAVAPSPRLGWRRWLRPARRSASSTTGEISPS